MGLFSGIKAGVAMVKGGIAVANACEKMDKLILQSNQEYKASLTPEELDLYARYNEVRLKKLDVGTAGTDPDQSASIEDEMEAAQTAYLLSLLSNGKLPQAFRDQAKAAVEEYQAASEKAMAPFARMLEESGETRK